MGGVGRNGPRLDGVRIAVLRPEARGTELTARLRRLGADVVHCPAIAIEPPASYAPLDTALADDACDWIVFTSVNAVEAVARRVAEGRVPTPRARLAAIGPATAAALRAHLREPSLVAPAHHSEGLAQALLLAAGKRILIPAGDLAGAGLAAALASRFDVTVVTAYRTVPSRSGIEALARELAADALDALVFTSGSTVRFVLEGLPGPERSALLAPALRPAVVCIGPATEEVASEAGLEVDAVADPHTMDGVIDALGRWFAARS